MQNGQFVFRQCVYSVFVSFHYDCRVLYQMLVTSAVLYKGPATQNAVCRSGLRSLSAAECYILSRLF